MIYIVLFVLVPIQQPKLPLLPASVDLILRLFVVLMTFRGNGAFQLVITKTCLYNTDPLKPHFYIVQLRFTGIYIIFLIFAQNIDCGYRNMKKSEFFI